jgi:hypothetical protein
VNGQVMRHRLVDVVLVTGGFILSPLSWWNDAVVNVPLAYLFSLPFSLVSNTLFLPSFLLGYWLSNLLGFLMMHWGGEGLLRRRYPTISVRHSVFVSLVYSIAILILVLLGWIPPPSDYLQ